MTYEEAYEKLNVMDRYDIAHAACYERPCPHDSEAAKEFYARLMEMKRTDRFGIDEQLENELSDLIIANNFDEWKTEGDWSLLDEQKHSTANPEEDN